ncbi:DeoR/GlpR family DNA-binding transcription regulator [Rhizobium sp. TRM95111]|uniref:DeoR/GlpR family DNA-binding transcription regulator n=1 Tax=Rhizobium alarense TaxID=2846851 RepID=UPI001F3EE66A|nr:DeoR/GlpR family DNA-binding transcription regulator [Rhizobium alarense]MCF3640052.1 DeoR/GlpR family DNA-binding transcription regulator [Rhizobium alarense]
MSVGDLLLGERQTLIRDRLAREGRVIAADLAGELGVSEDTIRRDLRELAAAGLCRRVYGGALPASPAAGSMAERLALDPERKDALARAAVALLPEGSTVFLDAGSTNLAIARAIPADRRLTVATNAPAIAAVLLEKPAVSVIQIGGQIDRDVGGAIGGKALRDVEALRPDICVLGVCGVDRAAGVTAYGFEDAEFKRFVASLSAGVLVAVTNDKLSTAAPYAVLPLGRLSHAVFEADADETELAAFAAAGINTTRAG